MAKKYESQTNDVRGFTVDKMKYLILLLFISGCLYYDTEYKCKDGVVYIKLKGAWIQSLHHSKNKCLEDSK